MFKTIIAFVATPLHDDFAIGYKPATLALMNQAKNLPS
jgi:hypothetical protein